MYVKISRLHFSVPFISGESVLSIPLMTLVPKVSSLAQSSTVAVDESFIGKEHSSFDDASAFLKMIPLCWCKLLLCFL